MSVLASFAPTQNPYEIWGLQPAADLVCPPSIPGQSTVLRAHCQPAGRANPVPGTKSGFNSGF